MDREHMQEVINGMRKIVKPYLAKQLKKINFEGCGNTDKAEFETDFEIVLTLAEKALAIPSAEPKWIPVSERLPEEDGLYLVYTEEQLFVCPFKEGEFFIDGVLAWMPLPPEPYEPQERSE